MQKKPSLKSMPSAAKRRAMRKALLGWYDREQRDLPWRKRPDAYRVVVSEFMLQQTKVATVLPYFASFTKRFGSFRALARASEEEVLAAWSGLGYYRRARALKRVAEQLWKSRRGQLPREAEELRALPGFGDYTTAAVGSIAFGLPLAAVDGNVRRVMARLFAIGAKNEAHAVRSLADEMLDRKRSGDWNQAVMELGALVCTPMQPRCLLCPLSSHCAALEQGRVDEFPVVKAQPKIVAVQEVAIAVAKRGKVLVLQRGDEASFAGMWELPRMDSRETQENGLDPGEVLFKRTRLRVAKFTEIGEAVSTFTHHRITTTLHRTNGEPKGTLRRQSHIAHRWVRPEELMDLAASKAQRRLFRIVFEEK